jgi:predicted anti-sigma-YlaC factor YlaD
VTCRDAIALLGDFLGKELDSRDRARLALHLAGCRPCRAYLRTYRKTARLAAGAATTDMPAEMKQRLRAFLIETLSRRRS